MNKLYFVLEYIIIIITVLLWLQLAFLWPLTVLPVHACILLLCPHPPQRMCWFELTSTVWHYSRHCKMLQAHLVYFLLGSQDSGVFGERYNQNVGASCAHGYLSVVE